MRNVNTILNVQKNEGSGDPVYPVTVEEMKSYLRLKGFIDVDASGDVSFNDDDTLISSLIITAVEAIEEKLGCSLIPVTITCLLDNCAGMIQLPYGPVNSVSSVTDDDDVVQDDVKVYGDNLSCPKKEKLTVVYEAGYSLVPKPIITEIKRLVGYLYINRGDDAAITNFQYQLANKYYRRSWLV